MNPSDISRSGTECSEHHRRIEVSVAWAEWRTPQNLRTASVDWIRRKRVSIAEACNQGKKRCAARERDFCVSKNAICANTPTNFANAELDSVPACQAPRHV